MRCEVKLGKDGVWYARPYLGVDSHGRQIRPQRSFPKARTREEAQRMADTWADALTADGRVASALLRDMLDDYVSMREAMGASPNSVRTWRMFASEYVGRYMPPSVTADAVRTVDVNRLERRLSEPKDKGGAGLSNATVLGVHYFLRAAFNHFVDAGVCDANPVVSAVKPSIGRTDAAVVGEWDFAALDAALREAMAQAASDPASLRAAACATAAWLALRTGLRCGEMCALRRRDVSPMTLTLRVGGTVVEEKGVAPYRRPRTKSNRPRSVAVTEREMTAVKTLCAAQDAVLGRLSPDSPVITDDGRFMRPSTLSGAFTELRKAAGLPKEIKFHSLRHTHATWWLSCGGDVKSLSERLGHADEATTLRYYAHAMPGRDKASAAVVSEAMERAR
ncbi:MAG: site-specific integrase [Slackia sp.]|nr:site-specific integrase [Slackia sp.]